jgi:elongation factor P
MSTITTADFTKGTCVIFKNEMWLITGLEYVNPGKGAAFVRTRLKNLKSGKVQDFTYKSGEKVEVVSLNTVEMSYLYNDGATFFFMHPETFEQYELPAEMMGNLGQFIKEGDIIQILVSDEKAITMRPPKKVYLKVTEAADGARGDTVGNALKSVTVETGAQVNVPLFIKEGDKIAIDPENGEYRERVNS